MTAARGLRALTIRQPWAWATIYAGKDAESRHWQTWYRGPLLIHAAGAPDAGDALRLLWTMADPGAYGQPRAPFRARGAIVGVVILGEIVTDSPSPWADPGCFHWRLESPAPIDPPVRCGGRPGLWKPPDAALAAAGLI